MAGAEGEFAGRPPDRLLSSDSSPAFQADVGALGRAIVAQARSRITVDGLLNEPDWLETPSVGEIAVDAQEKK